MILGFLGNIQSRVMEWVSYFSLNALGLVADNNNLGLLYPLRSYFVITDVEKARFYKKSYHRILTKFISYCFQSTFLQLK